MGPFLEKLAVQLCLTCSWPDSHTPALSPDSQVASRDPLLSLFMFPIAVLLYAGGAIFVVANRTYTLRHVILPSTRVNCTAF